jgi:hypothetical protein
MDGYLHDMPVRTMANALTDLRATYEKRPSPELARMIRQLETEIAERSGGGRPPDQDLTPG